MYVKESSSWFVQSSIPILYKLIFQSLFNKWQKQYTITNNNTSLKPSVHSKPYITEH